MIFSTGMFISAAGEYKCWLNALIQNLETSGFFFSLTSSKVNHFDLKHFKLKHTGTFKSSQISGNEWDLNCIVVDCVMLQPSPSWIWGGGRVGTQNIVKKERQAGIPVLWVCMVI